MYHLQVRGQFDPAVVRQETSAGDHEVPWAEVEMIHMFQEQEHLHAVSLHEETSGQDLLLAVGLHRLEVLAPEALLRSAHVTSRQDLDGHHLLPNGNDFLHQGEAVSMGEGPLEGPTHHLARSVIEAATDQGLALLRDVMTVQHFRIILGDVLRHLALLDQRPLVLREGLHLRYIQTELV
jgi:hypothetical protein